MNKKKIIVTLAAAMTIVIAVVFTMSQMGDEGPSIGGKRGKGPRYGGGGQVVQSEERGGENNNAARQPGAAREGGAPTGDRGTARLENQGESKRPAKGSQNTSQAQQTVSSRSSAVDIAEVGVVNVTPASYHAKVKGYGQASATHVLTLSAQVSGQITRLSSQFETGALLSQGEVLAYVDDTDYQQALASAEATYEAAYVALEEERLQGVQAQDEWIRSGLSGEPESELVLRAPQLKSAQAALREAQQNVKAAKRDLAFTNITAPFDALVVSRSVQPGSYVQVGTEIASLYSANLAEISIPLSPSQWAQLPDATVGEKPGWKVTLTDTTGAHQWQASIERIELHQDEDTRQRRAIAVVENPLTLASPLYFGTFLVADVEGKALDNVWKVPSSAISQKQEVWFVEPERNVLNKFTPTVLFEYEGYAYIEPLVGSTQAQIVARPLSNYLVNTPVTPVVEESADE